MIKEIIRFKKISSTQDTAKKFIHRHQEIAVTAEYQRHGRGRHGRQWSSPIGGLYVSFVLFPKNRITLIPFLASLAIVRLLEFYSMTNITIHWPNDVLLHNKKVCGILCEQCKDGIVCGIGLNVNTDRFPHTLNKVTSLTLESGQTYDLDDVLQHLIRIFNPLYQELLDRGLKVSEALNYITGLGEAVEVVTTSETFTATICDINEDWSLLVRDSNGVSKKLYHGDVRRLVW